MTLTRGLGRAAVILPVVVPLGLAVALSPAQAASDRGAGPHHRPAVTGYALAGAGTRAIAPSARALTTVTIDGVSLTRDGRGVSAPDEAMAATRRVARSHRLRTELLVSNFSGSLGDFDPRAAHGLLSSHANVSRLADTVAGYVRRGHYDGVNVDLERVPSRDAAGLVRLVSALQQAMPAARTVSIDVSAATSTQGYRRGGYRLGRLGREADVVQLMAYDQHGPTWSGPGPVGNLGWQRRAVDAALAQVPAARLDLGQAGYGYTWPTVGTGHTVTDRGARALVARDGATAVWHPKAGEWSAVLSDGTRLWWADARSYAVRVDLARRLRLHGLAVWRLGSADPLRN